MYGSNIIKREFITRAETGFFSTPYPGYPNIRFSSEQEDVVTIPDGPWSTGDFTLPTEDEKAVFLTKGFLLDAMGRPLHPWFKDMVSNLLIGVVSGKGAYWQWGPNYAADPIVITEEQRPRLLLIKRRDTGSLAFPGGFTDKQDLSPIATAIRELAEETGLAKPELSGEIIYQGVVADKRTTAHSWAETTAVLFRIPTAQQVRGQDDALSADWYYLDEISNHLFGSHSTMVKMAYEKLGLQTKKEAVNKALGES